MVTASVAILQLTNGLSPIEARLAEINETIAQIREVSDYRGESEQLFQDLLKRAAEMKEGQAMTEAEQTARKLFGETVNAAFSLVKINGFSHVSGYGFTIKFQGKKGKWIFAREVERTLDVAVVKHPIYQTTTVCVNNVCQTPSPANGTILQCLANAEQTRKDECGEFGSGVYTKIQF